MDKLPKEIICIIFNFLPVANFIQFGFVCKDFYKIMTSTEWKNYIAEFSWDSNILDQNKKINFKNYVLKNLFVCSDTIHIQTTCDLLCLINCAVSIDFIKTFKSCHNIILVSCNTTDKRRYFDIYRECNDVNCLKKCKKFFYCFFDKMKMFKITSLYHFPYLSKEELENVTGQKFNLLIKKN
jgi:hypothetical protein